ncbi:MAG: LPS export ABC transporter periplasmic protein LptC [Campylobacter sp.]|nr:LPS export ABC transporter periplasmic protein LptC [Campylobacter sp.]
MKIFLTLLFTFFVACSAENNNSSAEVGPQQQATKIIISQAQNAQNDWRLTAAKAEFFDAQNQVRLYLPVLIYSKNGVQEDTLKAKEGWFDISKNLIVMQGDVIVSSLSEGFKINTQEIYYDNTKKEAWAITPVKMKRGKTTLQAKGFKAINNFNEIELFNQKTILPKNMQDFKPAPLTLQEALNEN